METAEEVDPTQFVQSKVLDIKEVKPAIILRGIFIFLSHIIHNIEHENSVDCIAANPVVQTEFVTGSHDKSIKLWDVNKDKSIKTMTGHTEGVWCINYNKDGTQLVTASPEGIAKIWDPKSGKS